MSEIREIVTKAVIAKGRKIFRLKQVIPLENDIEKILGCWILNHETNCVLNDNTVKINGKFENDVWYLFNNETNIVKAETTYDDVIKLRELNCECVNDNKEICTRIINEPCCTNACIKDGTVELEIVFELVVEIIGETKIMVNVFDCIDNFDPVDDFENEINEDFLND